MSILNRLDMSHLLSVVVIVSLIMVFACNSNSEKGIDSTVPDTSDSGPKQDNPGDAEDASDTPLNGTKWQLVEFQSMDDTIGTIRPDDPSKYTMQLNQDGTVNLRLNCNYANGRWKSEPSSDPSSGSFEFSPLATTKALCPSPSMDEQISSQSQFIRSYLLKGGRLYLSLMADGGIYAWEPYTDNAFHTEPNPTIESAILKQSPDYTQEIVDIDGGRKARYVYGFVDLNEDGKKEVFAYLLGTFFCGTGGCSLMLFTPVSNGYELVDNFSISRLPVIISPEKTQGWNNLVRLESGGGAPPTYVTHTFDGKHYIEKDRLPADKTPTGTIYLTGELTFDKGIELDPNK